MPDVTNDLLYELLRRINADVGSLKASAPEMRSELIAIRDHQLAIQKDAGNIYGILHRHDERLAQIENRPELSEPAE